jgi:hypothetical protein
MSQVSNPTVNYQFAYIGSNATKIAARENVFLKKIELNRQISNCKLLIQQYDAQLNQLNLEQHSRSIVVICKEIDRLKKEIMLLQNIHELSWKDGLAA